MKTILTTLTLTLAIVSCQNKNQDSGPSAPPKTAITVARVEYGNINEQHEFQAITDYLNTLQVTAPISGYILKMDLQAGQTVGRGTVLFSMKSAEQQALNMAVAPTIVTARRPGVISSLGPQPGSFVTEGSVVCTITDQTSLVFKVKVPAEEASNIHQGTHCTLILPGGRRLDTTLGAPLPEMESTDQTINYVARAKTGFLPAGLIAKAVVTTQGSRAAQQLLPADAVQSDNNRTTFWVMRLKTDSTVEKIAVTLGNRNKRQMEILTPVFSPKDRFVASGAYGLTEDALVSIR